jgi:RNA-directed DNA polymerase
VSNIIKYLSQITGLRPNDIRGIINQAPVSYKRYLIAKRTGGMRIIAQPAREVKKLQRLLVNRLGGLPIHSAATAYVEKLSIRDNAMPHAGDGPIMKFDFSDFFTSIKDRDWKFYCLANNVFVEEEDVELSAKLFFTKVPGTTIHRLAIGAPSSPWLSNVLMFDFDRLITDGVKNDKVVYTRYADDLTFSAPRTGFLNVVPRVLQETLSRMEYPKLKINADKTVVATSKYRRVVTGLVLSNDGRITIGRDKKRLIRSALHRASCGELSGEEAGKLAGYLAYVKSVEPEYFAAVLDRYGVDIISKLASIQ